MKRMARLIAIGDIHGHLDKLNQLLRKVEPSVEDRLVFLGDYIDRGPDSKGVVDRLIAIKKQFPETIFLRGNHDQMLLDALIEIGALEGERLRDFSPVFAAGVEMSDLEVFLLNGGQTTLASYNISSLRDGLPEKHLAFIRETLFLWRFEQFTFVHAGIEAGVPLEQQDAEFLLWQRYAEPGRDGEIHVVGHHPTINNLPLFEEGRYSLDTGVAYGRVLTACDVFTKQCWQV